LRKETKYCRTLRKLVIKEFPCYKSKKPYHNGTYT
jgi:hypothetical protein